MACEDCEKYRQLPFTALVPFKDAEVEIKACGEHLKQIIDILKEEK